MKAEKNYFKNQTKESNSTLMADYRLLTTQLKGPTMLILRKQLK